MPQEIRVLQCFECKMFQVDLVKKANKWACKICGATQSVKKEYFRGNGCAARIKAQELNMDKGNQEKGITKMALEVLENEKFDLNVYEQNTKHAKNAEKISVEENAIKVAHQQIEEKWGTRKRNITNESEHQAENQKKSSKWTEFT